MTIQDIPAINATLNSIATLLITTGFVLVKTGRTQAHRKAMTAAIGASSEGVNENDIAAEVWRALVGNGGEFPGLPPFVTSGPRMCLVRCHLLQSLDRGRERHYWKRHQR